MRAKEGNSDYELFMVRVYYKNNPALSTLTLFITCLVDFPSRKGFFFIE